MINFLLSLQGGIYVLTLIDEYAAGFATMINGIFMCIAIGWVYGVRQFCSDIKQMIGHSVGYWWKAMWKVISPIIITVSKSSNLEEGTLSTLNVSHRKPSTGKCLARRYAIFPHRYTIVNKRVYTFQIWLLYMYMFIS